MPIHLSTKFAACARSIAWLTLGAALLAVPASADTPLTPHSAEYKVKISIVSGQLDTELRRTASGYIATHTIRPTGLSRMISRGHITESSEFVITDAGLRPEQYRSIDTISRDHEDVDIHFDWTLGEASGTVNDQAVVAPLEGIAHDRISIQYELMHDLLNGGPNDEYVLFDLDQLKQLNVTMVGKRTVEVPAGKFEAVGIRHQTDNSKRVTTLWCVEELGYLPVIIEQHRLGKLRVRAVLTKYEPDPA